MPKFVCKLYTYKLKYCIMAWLKYCLYLRELDNDKPATVRSQTATVAPSFSKSAHAGRTFVFLGASLLKEKSSNLFC